MKRSASASVSRPGASQVYAQFAADRTSSVGGADVEVATKLTRLDAVTKDPAHTFLVSTALGEDLLAVRVLEVAPFASEDRRHVELLRDDAEMRPQMLSRMRSSGGKLLRDRVQPGVKRVGAVTHRPVKKLLLRGRQRVERRLLDTHRLGEVAHRGAVESSLGEQPRRRARQLVPSRAHILNANDR